MVNSYNYLQMAAYVNTECECQRTVAQHNTWLCVTLELYRQTSMCCCCVVTVISVHLFVYNSYIWCLLAYINMNAYYHYCVYIFKTKCLVIYFYILISIAVKQYVAKYEIVYTFNHQHIKLICMIYFYQQLFCSVVVKWSFRVYKNLTVTPVLHIPSQYSHDYLLLVQHI